ncbi:gcvT [Acrasis kona]|uniref:GcvT n=1 Tax=Acrasis kona TaxID=1008807 RepID=A0AAW2YI97_9EUKA
MNTQLFALSILLIGVYSIKVSFKPEDGVNVIERETTKPGATFYDWKECYGESTSDYITPLYADLKFVRTKYDQPGIQISVQAKLNNNFTISPNEIFYKFEMWSEISGGRIRYKGPFDVCCGGFTLPSGMTADKWTESWMQEHRSGKEEQGCAPEQTYCPPSNGIFTVSTTRPLHRDDQGKYEANLVLYRKKHVEEEGRSYTEQEELLCVDLPFYFSGNKCDKEDQCWLLGAEERKSEDVVQDKSNLPVLVVDQQSQNKSE